jgi:hypothetical protein
MSVASKAGVKLPVPEPASMSSSIPVTTWPGIGMSVVPEPPTVTSYVVVLASETVIVTDTGSVGNLLTAFNSNDWVTPWTKGWSGTAVKPIGKFMPQGKSAAIVGSSASTGQKTQAAPAQDGLPHGSV